VKIFMFRVRRVQLVKMTLGLAVLAFIIRMVMGITDQPELLTVTIGGFREFTWVMLGISVVLLAWDMRDGVTRRRV
jgi:hypothetical protein